ncbi:MAG TPA: methyltransferase domain-containing protein [Thermoanaerobaculia bacterium]|nr:methyltransferase domain-containing protein [Thermoanaerobaculia bacterium]
MRRVTSNWPPFLKTAFLRLATLAAAVLYYGKKRYCPVCRSHSRKFLTFGVTDRKDALCPRCGALERHRLVWLYLTDRTDLFDGRAKQMLHVAPEYALKPRLAKQLGTGYITADIEKGRAMVQLDLMDIQYPQDAFDVVYCSHVLEHVPDDRRAMRELHRVLKPDGWAVLLVPMSDGETLEDPSVVDPQERLRLYGQEDHVRLYGRDYVDRLREAGFTVTVTTIADLAGKEDATLMGLTADAGEIYLCRKG